MKCQKDQRKEKEICSRVPHRLWLWSALDSFGGNAAF